MGPGGSTAGWLAGIAPWASERFMSFKSPVCYELDSEYEQNRGHLAVFTDFFLSGDQRLGNYKVTYKRGKAVVHTCELFERVGNGVV